MSTFVSDRNIGSSVIAGTVLSLYTLGGVLAGGLFEVTKNLKRFAVPTVFVVIAGGFTLILLGTKLPLVAIGAMLCGMGYFSIKPLFTLYLSYGLPTKAMTFISTLLLAATNMGIFFSNGWIGLANVSVPGLFHTEIERAFFAGIIVNIIFATIFMMSDHSSIVMINRDGNVEGPIINRTG